MYNFEDPSDSQQLDQAIEYHAKHLVGQLKACGLHIAAAESLTGGMLSSAICGVPGASEVFFGSFVTYTQQAKQNLLGVDPEIIREHSVYSNQCATEMADKARLISGAELAVSTTGIAGPTGGTPDRPVGSVFFGLSDAKRCQFFNTVFNGERIVIRKKTVLLALMIVSKGLE
ncbi:MAG: CinA family protein [Enterococcus sp.]|nr:CinA family protein [Enterococcus sp.]